MERKNSAQQAVDLNCDMGEGTGNDGLIMPFISSANIACGFHAGDTNTMWETIHLALKHKVAIGAHISFADKENFGRQEMALPVDEIYELAIQQLIILKEIADAQDANLHHVKPHGALYNIAARDARIANAIARAVKDFDPTLILVGLSGSCSISEAEKLGLCAASEVFADRRYRDDGSLVPRAEPGALIIDQEAAITQVLAMLTEGKVTTISGRAISIKAETVCIHGDGINPASFAEQLKLILAEEGIRICAP